MDGPQKCSNSCCHKRVRTDIICVELSIQGERTEGLVTDHGFSSRMKQYAFFCTQQLPRQRLLSSVCEVVFVFTK